VQGGPRRARPTVLNRREVSDAAQFRTAASSPRTWCSRHETLGRRAGVIAAPGDTVLLGGDLGAGKTLHPGLGCSARGCRAVTSRLVLLHSYRTSAGWDLLHADVCGSSSSRSHRPGDPELLEEGAAAVVEWGELAAPAWHLIPARGDRLRASDPDGGASGGADGARRLVFTAWPELAGTDGRTVNGPRRVGLSRWREMKLLAIETATRLVGCALWGDEGPLRRTCSSRASATSRCSFPHRRAVPSGRYFGGRPGRGGRRHRPGLVHGLRVGLATATTIATARRIPAMGVTSLEALAHRTGAGRAAGCDR